MAHQAGCHHKLGHYYDFVLSEEGTLEKLANKKFQYLAAEGAGVPIPETYYLDRPGSIEDVAGRVSYPCIIKPVYSHLWRQYVQKVGVLNSGKVIVCPSPEELINHWTRVADSGIEWVVQERIGGNDDQLYALYAYFNRASQPLAVFVKRGDRARAGFSGTKVDHVMAAFVISANLAIIA